MSAGLAAPSPQENPKSGSMQLSSPDTAVGPSLTGTGFPFTSGALASKTPWTPEHRKKKLYPDQRRRSRQGKLADRGTVSPYVRHLLSMFPDASAKLFLHWPEVRNQISEASKNNGLCSQAVSQMNVKRLFAVTSSQGLKSFAQLDSMSRVFRVTTVTS